MPITALANQKGGVGKTVVTGGCAHAVAARGGKVLLVDADPQGNTTTHFTGFTDENPPERTLADVLDRKSKVTAQDAIIATRRDGISILPSGFDELQAVQDSLVGQTGAEVSLKRALGPLLGEWDHILVDCRPATDLITRNALMASDSVIIVLQPTPDAITGFSLTLRAIDDLEEYLSKILPIAGFVVNLLDGRRNDHAKSLQWIRQRSGQDGIPILGDPIPSTADLGRLNDVGMGADEHPKPSARIRNIATNFGTIMEQLETYYRKAAAV